MKQKLKLLAERATKVAQAAQSARIEKPGGMEELHEAMIGYREAAIAYIADPSVAQYVRFDALKYDGETREALERIADLIDSLNENRE